MDIVYMNLKLINKFARIEYLDLLKWKKEDLHVLTMV
jgi:hypothetical protein